MLLLCAFPLKAFVRFVCGLSCDVECGVCVCVWFVCLLRVFCLWLISMLCGVCLVCVFLHVFVCACVLYVLVHLV